MRAPWTRLPWCLKLNSFTNFRRYMYKVENGFVVSPGKYEGEPEWVVTLHEMCLSGMADHSVHDGSMAIDAFELDADTAKLTGLEARPGTYVCLWSDDSGF